MRTPTGSNAKLAVALLFALFGFLVAEGLFAQNRTSRSSVGYRGAPAPRSSHSVPRPQQPSRLLPPAGLGSAANAPPGFYGRHLSVPEAQIHQPVPGHHPAQIYIPYPVYVSPPEYAVSPSQVGAPVPREVLPEETFQPAPAPQPIYVIQPQASVPSAPPSAPAYTPPPQAPAPAPEPVPREPAPVRFTIHPADAEVYLDDDFLGTAVELTARQQPLLLRPGVYVLEVTHPELPDQRLVFGFRSEEVTDVLVDLSADRPRQRSRIR